MLMEDNQLLRSRSPSNLVRCEQRQPYRVIESVMNPLSQSSHGKLRHPHGWNWYWRQILSGVELWPHAEHHWWIAWKNQCRNAGFSSHFLWCWGYSEPWSVLKEQLWFGKDYAASSGIILSDSDRSHLIDCSWEGKILIPETLVSEVAQNVQTFLLMGICLARMGCSPQQETNALYKMAKNVRRASDVFSLYKTCSRSLTCIFRGRFLVEIHDLVESFWIEQMCIVFVSLWQYLAE